MALLKLDQRQQAQRHRRRLRIVRQDFQLLGRRRIALRRQQQQRIIEAIGRLSHRASSSASRCASGSSDIARQDSRARQGLRQFAARLPSRWLICAGFRRQRRCKLRTAAAGSSARKAANALHPQCRPARPESTRQTVRQLTRAEDIVVGAKSVSRSANSASAPARGIQQDDAIVRGGLRRSCASASAALAAARCASTEVGSQADPARRNPGRERGLQALGRDFGRPLAAALDLCRLRAAAAYWSAATRGSWRARAISPVTV